MLARYWKLIGWVATVLGLSFWTAAVVTAIYPRYYYVFDTRFVRYPYRGYSDYLAFAGTVLAGVGAGFLWRVGLKEREKGPRVRKTYPERGQRVARPSEIS